MVTGCSKSLICALDESSRILHNLFCHCQCYILLYVYAMVDGHCFQQRTMAQQKLDQLRPSINTQEISESNNIKIISSTIFKIFYPLILEILTILFMVTLIVLIEKILQICRAVAIAIQNELKCISQTEICSLHKLGALLIKQSKQAQIFSVFK